MSYKTHRAFSRHSQKLHVSALKWVLVPVNAWGKWSNFLNITQQGRIRSRIPSTLPDTGLESHFSRFTLELPYHSRAPNLTLYLFFCRGLINGLLFRKKSPDVGEHGSFFLLSLELWLEIIGSVTGSNRKWQSLGYKAFASSLTIPPQNKT